MRAHLYMSNVKLEVQSVHGISPDGDQVSCCSEQLGFLVSRMRNLHYPAQVGLLTPYRLEARILRQRLT